VTSSLPIQGIAYMVATILSIDGNIALVRMDQAAGRTERVRIDYQRAKGDLPAVGEQWIVDKTYGNEWSFAMIISPSKTPVPPTPPPALIRVASLAERNAIASPAQGQMALRTDNASQDIWDGVKWRGMKPLWFPQIRPTLLGWTTVQNTASGTVYTVASATITDPGWSYYISASAGMLISVSDNTSGFSHNAALVVDSTTFPAAAGGAVISYDYLGTPQGGFGKLQLPYGKAETIWTGSHTVNFLFRNGATGTCSFGPLQTAAHYHFDIQLHPV
jgi:hypothetical protein